MKITRLCPALGMFLTCVSLLAGAASAAPVTVLLQDRNSEVEIDLNGDAGMSRWEVDGVSQLHQQWFWFRVGATAPERPLNALPLQSYKVSDGNLDPGNERVVASYLGAGFTVGLDFVLAGGRPGSHASDLAEIVSINNFSTAPLDLHFFQYADFDLGGASVNSSAVIAGGNTAVQTLGNSWLSETVATGSPEHHQVAYYADILSALGDLHPTTLTDFSGPLTNGDLTWAFQWDLTIAPGGSVIISKDKNLVPEPASLALILTGGAAAMFRRVRP